MPTALPQSRRPWTLMFIAVCLVAVNMRMTITGVGPLLEEIAAHEGVTPAALGGLASVPLIAWGLVSPLAHTLSLRLGVERAVGWSLVALGIGTVWRSLPGTPSNLWLGTALIGAALAVGNVLLPAVIRRDFGSRIPLVMGVYTALLGGLGAVSAGVVVPIAQAFPGDGGEGWRIALLCTGALIPPALAVWILASRVRRADSAAATTSTAPIPTPPPPGHGAARRIWRDPVAWTVALYMGLQSMTFYMIATWLAPIEISGGRSAVAAGIDVMLYQFVSIGGSLLLPFLYRGPMKRWLAMFLPLAISGSFACVVLIPGSELPWIVIGGLGSGASLSVSLLFMAVRARNQIAATALSGMAQAVGYLIAAAGPAAFGLAHEVSGGWGLPLALVIGIMVVQLVLGFLVGRERFVLDGPRRG
ncbi:MFS transporter [Leucobacter tenebrionis]|uniref:MFS transporter n=1 Tax=Leucobacter tenebrionis TaxID=2873270 RepID=UPI001CA75478|nr:MFS transporter [Leucobacter tenebrionis]QZY53482.1 MFS transporter [Leucobacter tenebrionis]